MDSMMSSFSFCHRMDGARATFSIRNNRKMLIRERTTENIVHCGCMPWFAIVSFTYGVNVNNTKTVILSFDTLPFRQYTYAFLLLLCHLVESVCVCVFKSFSSFCQPNSLTKFNRMIFHIEIIHIFDMKSFNRKPFYVSGEKNKSILQNENNVIELHCLRNRACVKFKNSICFQTENKFKRVVENNTKYGRIFIHDSATVFKSRCVFTTIYAPHTHIHTYTHSAMAHDHNETEQRYEIKINKIYALYK